MSNQKQDTGRLREGQPGGGTRKQLGVLVMCFDGRKTAAQARRSFGRHLAAQGDSLLDSTVVEVNAKHKAFASDPHRVVPGTLVPALTWGLFGLVLGSSGWVSAIIWAVIGAICGGLFSYYSVTHLSKSEWARIGGRLPADSSSLVVFVETADVRGLLKSTASLNPATASVAHITADLGAQVFAGSGTALEVPTNAAGHQRVANQATTLSMIMLRYAAEGTAKQTVAKMAQHAKGADPAFAVEIMVERHPNGNLGVVDPKYGTWGWAKSDLVSWGVLGVAVGLLSGLISGGLFGAVHSGIATGLIWAAFGVFAGALYGLWAGRAVTGRRLKGAARLLAPGTSLVVAWSEQPITDTALAPYVTADSRLLVLHFNAIEGGVVLEAS
jgi:hypothetical protein